MRTYGAQNNIDGRRCRRALVLVDGDMGDIIDTRIEQVIIDLRKIRENVNKAKECGMGPRAQVRLPT